MGKWTSSINKIGFNKTLFTNEAEKRNFDITRASIKQCHEVYINRDNEFKRSNSILDLFVLNSMKSSLIVH